MRVHCMKTGKTYDGLKRSHSKLMCDIYLVPRVTKYYLNFQMNQVAVI